MHVERGRHPFIAFAVGGVVAVIAAALSCGRMADSPDASLDASSPADALEASSDGPVIVEAGPKGDGSCGCDWNDCAQDAGTRWSLGYACSQDSDCCSQHCVFGSCQRPTCISDQDACTGDSECCSGSCAGGSCAPLNATCKVMGNACSNGNECCSAVCKANVCVQGSFCAQNGELCTKDLDCCGGVCTRADAGATFGLCGMPAWDMSGAPDGVICGGSWDGGAAPCGGDCSSRYCAPWGPLQIPVCMPVSGCRPWGGLCYANTDCCGGDGVNPKVVCLANVDGGAGVCSNPTGCKPNGAICRLTSSQCNATDNCCSGYVPDAGTCRQDNLGVPRCSYPSGEAGSCLPANASCASSADCCNAAPCVPADGGFACYGASCVPASGACTQDADCCVGTLCDITGGRITGVCRSTGDGGPACALSGQSCTSSSDCCYGTPCTKGRCEYPVY